MRYLKFRAWDKRDKTLRYFNDLYWFEENCQHNNGDYDYEVSQSTGMIDSYKREIYEGDLVNFLVRNYGADIVKYENQEVIYKNELGMFVFGDDEYCMSDWILEIKVVGNKWENKE